MAIDVFGVVVVAAVFLAVYGFRFRSPFMIWAATLPGTIISVLGGFSIGPLIFLPVCLLLAVAAGLRLEVDRRTWWLLMLAAFVVWLLVALMQMAGLYWSPWVFSFALVWLLGTMAVWCWPRGRVRPRSGAAVTRP